MSEFFAILSRAIESTSLIAFGAAFAWGILSMVLSPCHLSSIPLIVGFIGEQGRLSARKTFIIASLFALGILITIALVGVITAAAGRMLGAIGPWGNYFVALIFALVGLHLLDILPAPWTGPGQVRIKRRGLVAAFVLGLIFGIAIGPCTFAYMAPMLGVAFKLGAERPVYGAALLTAYGVGHCSIIVAAGACTGVVQRYLNWNERSRGTTILKKICGVLVLAGALYLIHTA